jgi:hypothetical protein
MTDEREVVSLMVKTDPRSGQSSVKQQIGVHNE